MEDMPEMVQLSETFFVVVSGAAIFINENLCEATGFQIICAVLLCCVTNVEPVAYRNCGHKKQFKSFI